MLIGQTFGPHIKINQTNVGRTCVSWSYVGRTNIGRTNIGRTKVGRTKVASSFMMKKKRNFFTMSFNVGLSTRGSVRSNLMRSLFSKTEKSDYERKKHPIKA